MSNLSWFLAGFVVGIGFFYGLIINHVGFFNLIKKRFINSEKENIYLMENQIAKAKKRLDLIK